MGALIGKLRNAPHRIGQLPPLDHHVFVVVARQHRFVIRELPGQNAGNQQAMLHLEKEMALVLRKFELRVGACRSRKLLDLVHGFLGDKHLQLGVHPCEFVVCFRQRQAMAVGRNHGQRVRPQNQ